MTAEPTGFLYPFIESEERDAEALLADLGRSALSKIAESHAVRAETLERCATELLSAGRAMADRFGRGGRLLAFGNGGSSTDADSAVALFRDPPSGRPLPALSLVDDRAVLTALANDIGFDVVFSRQLIAHGRDVDIAVGFSTSGGSSNVLRAFEEAARRGMLTVGLAGYEGGAMLGAVDHCLVVRSQSIHRIQEAQDALMLRLWSVVQEALP
ncbi:MAG: SIS domain-containing protein [Actinomycetota bacterium]|jgi:D-sedoheptulose 7-phosphate isomerase|nr:SIS domain-containing protein [Actinomycetota bacterium]